MARISLAVATAARTFASYFIGSRTKNKLSKNKTNRRIIRI